MLKNPNNLIAKSIDWDFDKIEFNNFKKNIWNNVKKIEGYLSVYEAFYLHQTALNLKPETRSVDLPDKRAVVEIGAYKGKSTICIALGLLKNQYKYKFKSIDPLYQDKKHLAYFKKLLKKFKVEKIVDTQGEFSEAAFEKWDPNFLINMLWIDGNHEYDFVSKDFELWSKYLMPNGVIIFHDFYLTGVREVIYKNILTSEFFNKLVFIDGNLLSAKKIDHSLSIKDKIMKKKFFLTIENKTNSLLLVIIIILAKKLIELKNIFFTKSNLRKFDD